MWEEIERIASRIRAALEECIRQKPDIEQSTQGFCIVAAKALEQRLNSSGYPSTHVRAKFKGKGHAWVETHGKIVDITQDQYGGRQQVFIGDIGDERYTRVCGDEAFEEDMGAAGDDGVFGYIDDDGEECPIGTTNSEECPISTTNSVVQEVLGLYDNRVGGSDE